MMEKIKSNLAYVGCAILGLLNFILLAIPYISSYYSYDLGEWGGKQSSSDGISGYKVMDLWEGGFSGVMSSLIQLFVLLGGIALLAWGVLGLLKAFGIFDKFPDRLGRHQSVGRHLHQPRDYRRRGGGSQNSRKEAPCDR